MWPYPSQSVMYLKHIAHLVIFYNHLVKIFVAIYDIKILNRQISSLKNSLICKYLSITIIYIQIEK